MNFVLILICVFVGCIVVYSVFNIRMFNVNKKQHKVKMFDALEASERALEENSIVMNAIEDIFKAIREKTTIGYFETDITVRLPSSEGFEFLKIRNIKTSQVIANKLASLGYDVTFNFDEKNDSSKFLISWGKFKCI